MKYLYNNYSNLLKYRVHEKKCPNYKIVSMLDICKITDTNSNQKLI